MNRFYKVAQYSFALTILFVVIAQSALAQIPPGALELNELRTKDTKTFVDANGAYHLSKTAGSFHFINEQNVWEDIQSGITFSHDGQQAGIFRTDLPIVCDLYTGEVTHTMVKNADQITTGREPKLEVWTSDHTIVSTQSATNGSAVSIENNLLRHSGYFEGIDRIQRYEYYEVANDFVIHNRPQGLPENGYLVFTEKWAMPSGYHIEKVQGIETEAGWNGRLIIKNGQNEIMARVSAPVFYDAIAHEGRKEGEIHSTSGTFVFSEVSGGFIVSVLVPQNWLMRDELVFPVVIDPTLSNTYAAVQGLQDWQNGFSTNCQASLSVTLPAGGTYTVTNTSTQYTIRSKGTIVVGGFTTYYAAGFEQRSRVGYNGSSWTPTQFGFGDSMNPQNIPYSIFSSSIANGCYPGGTVLPFNWQGYQTYFPDYSGPALAAIAGCTTTYHELMANTWIVTVTYDVFQLNVISNPAVPVICSGSPAGISLTSSPAGASFTYTATAFGASGAVGGTGNSIQNVLSTTADAPGFVSYTVTPTLNNCVGTPQDILVTVNPGYTLPVVNAQICTGESYSFAGNNYTTSGLYTVNLFTSTGCDSIVSLNLNVVNSISSTINESICDGDDYYFNGDFYSQAGTYTAELLTASGCDSIITLNLIVNPVFESAFSASICQGSAYEYDNINYTTSGVYPHYYQTAAGCDSIVTFTLEVTPPTTIVTNATICEGLSYTFEGQTYSIAGTYQADYVDANGCDSLMVLNLAVTSLAPYHFDVDICESQTYTFNGQTLSSTGVYTAQLQTAQGCDSTAVLHLTVHPEYAITQNVSICDGEVHFLGGIPHVSSGVYVYEFQTAFGCDSIITLNLTVNPIPVVDIGDEFDLCEGESVVLSNSVNATNYNWSTGSTSSSITVSSTGVYKLIINGVGNCIGMDSANVIVHPLPGGFIDSQRTLCDGDLLVLDGGNPANEYMWSTGETTQMITIDRSGNYSVLITSPFGCEKQYAFEVGYFCEPSVYVPNSFTPNNDGINDEFMVYGEFIAELDLKIFDRWGNSIFQTNDVAKPVWTGGVSGGDNYYVPDGFYSWILKYKFYTDTFGGVSDWKELKGTVTIVR